MSSRRPLRLRQGPLTVYLKPLIGCPDLGSFVRALPSSGPVIWLDSARPHAVTGRWSLVGCHPWLTVVARGDRIELRTSAATHHWREHPLEALRGIVRRYGPRSPAAPADASDGHRLGAVERGVGLMGFLSYDLNRWIERLPPPHAADTLMPDMLWWGMRIVILVDHAERCGWLLSVVDPHGPPPLARREALETLARAETQLAASSPADSGVSSAPAVDEGEGVAGELEPTTTQAEFERMVRRALDYIQAGDLFQANLSQRFTTAWQGPLLPLYRRLRRINPSPFACFLSCEELSVVSCSPERLVRVQEGRVDTRPIAGTRPRGDNPTDDAINSLDLLLSEKERAEHIMLVDLARNDLGRVCDAGSVTVGELLALEAYSHVIHIVSDVSGRLRRGVDAVDIIRAVFPGGTITGCPKVRCMEILRELEPVPRELYTGSLGYLGFDGTMDLNIAIRTMIIQKDRLTFHVGAGIVADSDPEREYQETLAKAGALVAALGRSPRPPVSSLHAAAR